MANKISKEKTLQLQTAHKLLRSAVDHSTKTSMSYDRIAELMVDLNTQMLTEFIEGIEWPETNKTPDLHSSLMYPYTVGQKEMRERIKSILTKRLEEIKGE